MNIRAGVSASAIAAAMVVGLAAETAPASVQINFAAVVGDKPFACGQKYEGIGTTKSTITVSDFRFFVSGVALIDKSGTETAVALTQDGKWQSGNAALIDVEDGTATCSNGTPDTRAFIEGTVPAGEYVGLRFDVGLPFDVNHKDPTTAPSPLNLSRLFWNWNGGYKFARIDMKTTGQPQGWVLHLGSTNCSPDNGPTSVPTTCANENKPRVVLTPFNAATQAVQLDLAAMLAQSNVDVNTNDTASGCMSGNNDPECKGVFATLGLPFGDVPAGAQSVFTAIPRR